MLSRPNRMLEDEKKYKKALRFIYKYGQETNKLTEEAAEACKRQGINPEDLTVKTLEDFAPQSNDVQSEVATTRTQSPMTRHYRH